LAARSASEPLEQDGADPKQLLLDQGVFYLLLLEPDHDPGRFKVGFAINLPDRLRALRCSAPFAIVIKSWPCKNLWEKTAIECVSEGCERLHTEVFRTASIETVIAKCESFFALMPKLSEQRNIMAPIAGSPIEPTAFANDRVVGGDKPGQAPE
jgi:hypothetical protein